MNRCSILLIILGFSLGFTEQDSAQISRMELKTELHSSWELASWFDQHLRSNLNAYPGLQLLESTDTLLKPTALLSIRLAPEIISESRASVFFWQGIRKYELSARVQLQFLADTLESGRVQKIAPNLQADLSVDTLVSMGYCGILDCHVRPLDAKTRLDLQKRLMKKWVHLLMERIDQLLGKN